MTARSPRGGAFAPHSREANTDRAELVLLAAAILGILYVVYASITWLPVAHAVADAEESARITASNKAFCEKYGMPQGTARHEGCTADLRRIRLEESERLRQAIAIF